MLQAGQTPDENFRNLHAAGCIQTMCNLHENVEDAHKAGYERFCQIMLTTRLDPCDGCPKMCSDLDGVAESCEANVQYYVIPHAPKRKLSSEEKIKRATTPNNGIGKLSVAQIAAEYKVSKSVIRRLKAQGKLKPEILKEMKENANVS